MTWLALILISSAIFCGIWWRGRLPPSDHDDDGPAGGALALLAVGILLSGCADPAPVAVRPDAQAGAAAAATRAAAAVSAADAAAADAARAEGQAAGAQLWAEIDPVPERIRAAAEARIQAASARAVADALRRHADQADAAAQTAIDRARIEREAEARALAEREAEADRTRTRTIAGLVVAGCIAAAAALLWLGLRSLLWLPATVAIGALALAAWSSVPWLPAVLGLALAIAILGGLAIALRTAIREWRDYADGLGRAMPEAKSAHDDASIGRQSRPVRWLISNLLTKD